MEGATEEEKAAAEKAAAEKQQAKAEASVNEINHVLKHAAVEVGGGESKGAGTNIHSSPVRNNAAQRIQRVARGRAIRRRTAVATRTFIRLTKVIQRATRAWLERKAAKAAAEDKAAKAAAEYIPLSQEEMERRGVIKNTGDVSPPSPEQVIVHGKEKRMTGELEGPKAEQGRTKKVEPPPQHLSGAAEVAAAEAAAAEEGTGGVGVWEEWAAWEAWTMGGMGGMRRRQGW